MSLKVRARAGRLYVWGKYRGQEVRKSTGLRVGQEAEARKFVTAEQERIDRGEPAGSLDWDVLRNEGRIVAAKTEVAGDWGQVQKWTVADAAKTYLADPAFIRSRSTQDYVERIARVVGSWRIVDFDEAAVERYLKARFPGGTSVNNRARELRALRALLRYVGERSRGVFVAPRIRVEEMENLREVYLSAEQVEAVLRTIWDKWPWLLGVWTTFAYQGARPIELARLEWGRDVRLEAELDRCHLIFRSRKGKGGAWRTRTNPMHPRVKAVLEMTDVEERVGAVFRNSHGVPWSATRSPAWLKYWPEIREAAGLAEGVVAYDLRHTFATRIGEAGGDLADVGKLLGHTNPKTTMRYRHIDPGRLRGLATGI